MIDIEKIRRQPELFKQAIANKRVPLDLDELLHVDVQRRQLIDEVNHLRQERNRISKIVAGAAANKEEQLAQARVLGEKLAQREAILQALEADYARLMALVPGLPAQDVPAGQTDKDNVEIRRWGQARDASETKRDHIELAMMHGMLDFEGARQIAGSRAYALLGMGALLEMAVLRFALDHILKKNFLLVAPPLLVRHEAMFGTGYFPLGDDNAYELERDKLYLTGTCEVGIVAVHANKVFEHGNLPQRYVGISPCFRREAGAAGRDTRGLYRVHQFQKVEQVVFCENDADISMKEHYALLQNSEEILQALELPYRVVTVCTGDMGLGQVFKHDIETWMPSRQDFGETHSCSTFHDFQSRRLGIKYRDADGRRNFVHTLNNTAIASPRILIALLENHQNPDGTINVPAALRPYLSGVALLEPGKKSAE